MVAFVRDSLVAASKTRCFESVLSWLERRDEESGGLLRIVTWHRVDEAENRPDLYPGMISASPQQFQEQVRLLASRFNVVSLAGVLTAWREQAPLPERAVLLTFDDACRDFAQHAWPVLQEAGLPVTLFVPTAFPDQPERHFWWDRVYRAVCRSEGTPALSLPWGETALPDAGTRMAVFRRLKEHIKSLPHDAANTLIESICRQGQCPPPVDNGVLSWKELRQLHAEGVTLAPHTQTHPMLNQLPEPEIERELAESRRDLQREIGAEILPVLAYPAGGVDTQVTSAMHRAGYELGMTTRRGINQLHSAPPFLLRRINIGRRTTPGILRAQLLPQFRHFARK